MATNASLITNVADGLALPQGVSESTVNCVQGDYEYYHYGCDGLNDCGWGCGYRTLQTLCSWIRHKHAQSGKEPRSVPTLEEIQKALVAMEDKPSSFVKSKQWIGSFEVALCLDYFYDIPGKILHIGSGSELSDHIKTLEEHFSKIGAPVMMGGDSDNASKGILGVCNNDKGEYYFLILDPHYYGSKPDQETLSDKKYLLWRPVSTFMENSFYNLCLPQYK